MKKMALLSMVFILCIGLTGCAFIRADMLRAQGKDIMVLGPWGYVHCQNAAITLEGSTEGTNFKKKDNPKLMAVPSIQELGPVPINIGKSIDPSEMMQPEPNTTSSVTSPLGGSSTTSSIVVPAVPDK